MSSSNTNQNNFGEEDPMSLEISRIQKNFIDELESLRREEAELIGKFQVELSKNIFIENWDQNFSFENNINLFLSELNQVEEVVYGLSDRFDQNDINIVMSQLRILREKGKTAMTKAEERIKELSET